MIDDFYNLPLLPPSPNNTTPLVRIPNPPLLPSILLRSLVRRIPILRFLPFSPSQMVILSPFVVATVLACTINSSFLGDAARTGFVPLAMLPFVIGCECGLPLNAFAISSRE